MQFDAPSFKVLASNDTSSAPGHQGGIVIPKDIAEFFPELPEIQTVISPTVDASLTAELFDGSEFLGQVITRYQFQTWGSKRTPERRLTSNLNLIRDKAAAGDVVLFQRAVDDPSKIRITLIKKETSDFGRISGYFNGKRWGVLQTNPASLSDVKRELIEIEKNSAGEFSLFADEVQRNLSSVRKISRERAFQSLVLRNFDGSCAISGRSMRTESGALGIDAAHIVPLSLRGCDDVRNGIALSKELHWAFDNGLIGIEDGKVVVSNFVLADNRNLYLRSFSGKPVAQGIKAEFRPKAEAFAWHVAHILRRDNL